MPSKKHRTVVAQKFVLVDKDGTTRAELKLIKDDQPALVFLDKAGKKTLILCGAERTPCLHLFDGNEKLRATLGIAPDGLTALIMKGEGGGGNAYLGIMPEPSEMDQQQGILILKHDNGERIIIRPKKDTPEGSSSGPA